jgi:hypothetical protein
MRRYTVFDGPISLETLDLRLSPSSLLLGGCQAPLVCSAQDLVGDDPLPDPEPPPGTDPGTNTPITPPPLPPSGPIGPGTS